MTVLIKWTVIALVFLLIALLIWVYFATYHPAETQAEAVISPKNAPVLEAGQKLKVLNWNVQYMAGKNYVFFYDLLDGSGTDTRPSAKDIEWTLAEVARIINEEKPDIILLQEVDEGAKRTDYQDQLEQLLLLLPKEYSSYSSAFYWKAAFVPHPKIWGKVGMKLSTISKYKIKEAVRHQLALMPDNLISQQFNLKRAVLETRLPVRGGRDLIIMNTHLDAFAQGSNTMEKQVKKVQSILAERSKQQLPWLIGGDFNLLPPGKSFDLMKAKQKVYYKNKSEIEPLFKLYQAVPSLKDVNGLEREKWFTHFPNASEIKKPDRTIDYIFLSNDLQLNSYSVRQAGTLKISDHLPVIAEFKIP